MYGEHTPVSYTHLDVYKRQPFFSTEKLFDNYYEYGITWNGIDCCSELKYYDEKYISFYNFNLNMAATAAHPIHAYTCLLYTSIRQFI